MAEATANKIARSTQDLPADARVWATSEQWKEPKECTLRVLVRSTAENGETLQEIRFHLDQSITVFPARESLGD